MDDNRAYYCKRCWLFSNTCSFEMSRHANITWQSIGWSIICIIGDGDCWSAELDLIVCGTFMLLFWDFLSLKVKCKHLYIVSHLGRRLGVSEWSTAALRCSRMDHTRIGCVLASLETLAHLNEYTARQMQQSIGWSICNYYCCRGAFWLVVHYHVWYDMKIIMCGTYS